MQELLKRICHSVDDPIRESLKERLVSWEDGVSKDEFMSVFETVDGEESDRWTLVCLFYKLDVDDVMDETIQFETLVKVISAIKGIEYVAPGSR